MTTEEVLVALADAAPANLGAGLRILAGAAPRPALAAMYEEHVERLAEIEALRLARQLPRSWSTK